MTEISKARSPVAVCECGAIRSIQFSCRTCKKSPPSPENIRPKYYHYDGGDDIIVNAKDLNWLIKEIWYTTRVIEDSEQYRILNDFAEELGYMCINDVPKNK